MPVDMSSLIRGVRDLLPAALDAGAAEMDAESGILTTELRASIPHGRDTGATEESLNVRRVGRGESGAAGFQASQAAVESLNPGHAASAPVSIAGEVGAIADSGTDYQPHLEHERAGRDATLTPFVPTLGQRMTQAFARGAKKRLG